MNEMKMSGCNEISCLHITSWDKDHCNDEELKLILQYLRPEKIEHPGYAPDTDCGRRSLNTIKKYCANNSIDRNEISHEFVNSLESSATLAYNNVLYNPTCESEKHNDNSIVQLFGNGRFTVLSLGDCEDVNIAKRIMECGMATNETDVLILAHHGADNGFTTKEFIRAIKPKIAICSSDFNNQYEHPKQEIRDLLYLEGVTLFTTKTGDVIITCEEDNNVKIYNLKNNSEDISSMKRFIPKCNVD